MAEGSSHIKWFIKKNLVLFRPQKHGFEWFWRQLLILLLPVSDGDIWWSLIRRSLITWLQLEVRIKRLKSANFLNWCCNQMAGYNKSNCFGRFLSQKNQRHWHLEQWRHPRPLFSCRYFNAQLQIFQCTVANISMQGKEIFQCRAKKYFNAEQRNVSMQSKEAVSGSLSGATQELDSGDWTQLFPHSTHLCSAVLQAENIWFPSKI